jgi:lipopolysaccharide biosynthesis protein
MFSDIFKLLRRPFLATLRGAFKVLDAILDFFGRIVALRSLVRRSTPGADPQASSDRAAVYVHFDRRGVVHDYVVHQLRELVDAGFRTIFVTNSPEFPIESEALVAPFCRTVMWRHNVGYDFGAYKDGLKAVGDTDNLSGVLLMNDSIYGPFWSLKDTLATIDPATTDYWGIVDSWEHNYHIQSFFMYFLPTALRSRAFVRFWSRFPYVNNKGWVIRNGEIKLSRQLARQKLRGNVLASYWAVTKTVMDRLSAVDTEKLPVAHRQYLDRLYEALLAGKPVNPMHYFWDVLILDYKCPFIKRELIKLNPADVPFTWRWNEAIQETSDYDITMIQRHLQT